MTRGTGRSFGWRAIAAVAAGASFVAAACNPDSNPDPPFGPAQFRIYRTDRLDPSINDTLWARSFVPGATLAFGPNDIAPASTASLSSDFIHPLRASLFTPDGESGRPLEAQLFTRDPEEIPLLVQNLVDKDAFMFEVLTPSLSGTYRNAANQLLNNGNATLADGYVLPYPVAGNTGTATDTELGLQSFKATPPYGPVDGGSVRAVRFIQNGLCARTEPFSKLTQNAATLIPKLLQPNCKSLTELRLDWATVAPTLRHQDSDPAIGPSNAFDARGGMAFNAGAYAKLNPFGSCFVKFTALYEIVLNQGIAELQLKSKRIDGDGGGLCTNGFKWLSFFLAPQLSVLLNVPGATDLANGVVTTGIPVNINTQIRALQTRDTVALQACNPTVANAPETRGNGDGCAAARQEFAVRMQQGANAAGLSDPGAIASLVAAANRLDNGRFTNWTCTVTNPTVPDVGRCQYVARARRLIVNPDDVRLVWFDNMKDYTNSALSFYYYIQGLQNPSTVLSSYCSDTSQPRPFSRSYGVVQLPPYQCPP